MNALARCRPLVASRLSHRSTPHIARQQGLVRPARQTFSSSKNSRNGTTTSNSNSAKETVEKAKEVAETVTEGVKDAAESVKGAYETQLDTRPLLTKAITCGVIAAAGDAFCQLAIEDSEDPSKTRVQEYELIRSMRFAVVGIFFTAPTGHIWFRLLAKTLVPGPKSWTTAAKRVMVDQGFWMPIFMFIYLSSLWGLEGSSIPKIRESLEREYVDVVKAGWALWVPAQFFNFALVPLKYQVLYTNAVEFVWYTYLSYQAAGKGEEVEKGNAKAARRRRTVMSAKEQTQGGRPMKRATAARSN